MDSVLWGLTGLVVLLIIDGLFSSARAALVNVRRQSLRDWAEQGNRRAALAFSIAEDSSGVLSTFQLANQISHFLLAALIATLLLPRLTLWLSSVLPLSLPVCAVITYLVVIPISGLLVFLLTETLPEVLAQHNPLGWVMALIEVAWLTVVILKPFVALAARLRRSLAAPGSDLESTALVTEEEIMTLVDAGEEGGSIEQAEKEMIYSIFHLDETIAREIMVPRIDVVALEIDTPLSEAREVIIKAGHSRIPVYETSLDNIKGLLYAKDLLAVWHSGDQTLDMASLLRPAMFVPESKRASDLLRELQSAKVHMAIVIDEYGGTAGLVTIEDVVEEIVGEILDEYDEEEEAAYEKVGDGDYIFDARINLGDLNHLLDTDLSDELGDTLGGFIYAQLGKVPEVGEVVETTQVQLEVLSVVNRRIRKVRVKQLSPHKASAKPQEGDKGDDSNGNGH